MVDRSKNYPELSGRDYYVPAVTVSSQTFAKQQTPPPAPEGEGGASKGSSGSTTITYTEQPNTLQSDFILSAVDLLCEGPVVGLWNGVSSVFLNNIALVDPDTGIPEFYGIATDFRPGRPDQRPSVYQPTVSNPTLVGVKVTNGIGDSDTVVGNPPNAPYLFQVGAARGEGVFNPHEIQIIIQIPSLTSLDESSGVLGGESISMSIWCQGSDMTGFEQVLADTIHGKCTAAYQRAYRVRPIGEPPWIMRVQRDSQDLTKTTETGDLYVYSYAEMFNATLTYMNSATLTFIVDASQFGQSMPVRSYDMLGMIVEVPSNYDPYGRGYYGIWDGTFKNAWTNNPAWIMYALLTNKRWGLGKQIHQSAVDKWALYSIGQYCDEQVPNHAGGTECRFSFNGIIQQQQDAYTVINAVASCFRGMAYWSSGTISFAQDRPTGVDDNNKAYSVPAAVFGPANVENGDFSYEGTALKARHSICLVTFINPRLNYTQDVEAVESPNLITRYGQRILRVVAYGCTSRTQAHRYGLWILASEEFNTETVTFTTGLDYTDLVPGTIIGIADPHRSGDVFAGRVVSFDPTSQIITLDRKFTFDNDVTYQIVYENPSGEGIVTRTITDTVTLGGVSLVTVDDNALIQDLPVPDSMYVITSSTNEYRLFRIISNKEKKTLQSEITAVEHTPEVYDKVDYSEQLIAPGITPYSSWPIRKPRNLSSTHYVYMEGGVTKVNITLSWSPPASPNPADAPGSDDPRVTTYDVAELIDGTWTTLVTTSSTTYTVVDVTAGTYQFTVRANSLFGSGPWSNVVDNSVQPNLIPPATPANYHIDQGFNQQIIRWVAGTDVGLSGYYIYVDGEKFDTINNPDAESYVYNYTDINIHTYSLVAFNTNTPQGLSSQVSLNVTPKVPPDPAGFTEAFFTSNTVVFEWTDPPPTGCSYEIRAGASWDSGTVVADIVTGSKITVPYTGAGSTVFWCRTKSAIGMYSALAVPTSGAKLLYASSIALISVPISKSVSVSKTFIAAVPVTCVVTHGRSTAPMIANVAVSSLIIKSRGIVGIAAATIISVIQKVTQKIVMLNLKGGS